MNEIYFELYFRKNPVPCSILQVIRGTSMQPEDFMIQEVNEAVLLRKNKKERALKGCTLNDVLVHFKSEYREILFPLMCRALQEKNYVD